MLIIHAPAPSSLALTPNLFVLLMNSLSESRLKYAFLVYMGQVKNVFDFKE